MSHCTVSFYYLNLCGSDDGWRSRVILAELPLSNIRLNYSDCNPQSCNREDPRAHHCQDAWLLYLDATGQALSTNLIDNSGSAGHTLFRPPTPSYPTRLTPPCLAMLYPTLHSLC